MLKKNFPYKKQSEILAKELQLNLYTTNNTKVVGNVSKFHSVSWQHIYSYLVGYRDHLKAYK